MTTRADFCLTAYRWVFVACLTLLTIQLVSHIALILRNSYFFYQMALQMMGHPRVIAKWCGWLLLILTLIGSRLKKRLFYFGLGVRALTILVTWRHPFIFA